MLIFSLFTIRSTAIPFPTDFLPYICTIPRTRYRVLHIRLRNQNPSVYDKKEVKCAFVNGNIKGNADLFEEYYYNLESATVTKVSPAGKNYTVGQEISVSGDSYNYPDSFDVIVFRDRVAVTVRNKKIESIEKIEDYTYTGLPVVNSRGFAVKAANESEYAQLRTELDEIGRAHV